MVLTEDHLTALKRAALPIHYGKIILFINEDNSYLDIEVDTRTRISKESDEKDIKKIS